MDDNQYVNVDKNLTMQNEDTAEEITEEVHDINTSIMKSIIKVVLIITILIVVVIVSISGAYFYYLNQIDKPITLDNKEKLTLTIKEGMGIDEISKLLMDEKVISNPYILKAYMFLNKDKVIQAGYYKIDPVDLNLAGLVDIFQKGSFETKLTFPEGWRIEQYRDYLEEEMGKEFADQFMDSKFTKEGYMFPDTYIVEKDYSPENLASFMRNTFDKKVSRDLIDQAGLKGLSEEEVIILASILEREMNNSKDRPIVAGILIKRIQEGWYLNADATIQYAKGTKEDWWPTITVDDYQGFDTPYNSYTNKGLPPGPISNPSLNSIESVVNYEESPYYFYITGSDGVTYYATTLEEHRENIDKYIK